MKEAKYKETIDKVPFSIKNILEIITIKNYLIRFIQSYFHEVARINFKSYSNSKIE